MKGFGGHPAGDGIICGKFFSGYDTQSLWTSGGQGPEGRWTLSMLCVMLYASDDLFR